MLPKVNRDDFLNQNSDNNGASGTNKITRLLSTVAPANNGGSSNIGGVRGVLSSKGVRRPISTKAAHLSTIPLEPTFLSPQPSATTYSAGSYQQDNSRSPYLPYSASSPTRVNRQNNPQQHRSATFSNLKWKGDRTEYKSEYSSYVTRARSHSHRTMGSAGGKAWSSSRGPAEGDTKVATKTMPYLLPKTAKQRVLSSSTKTVSSSSDRQQQQSNDEVVYKKPEELQTSTIHLVGGMVMTGTGKPSVVVNGTGGPVYSSLTKDRVQVCRTKEEKDKNPDTIRLDKRGVRVFPDIGGGESATLKLLSLQHNLITRLENVPLLSQLVVLDLYDNRVERICGLQGLPSLRVLLLGKNRIKRIEGLDSLKRLEVLDMHGNNLRYIDNLGSLSSLRVLNVAGNLLRNIRNLGPYGLSSLAELNLKKNRIKNLDGLQKAPHLKKLLLANNELPNISALAPLRKLFFLNELVIDPNPLIGTVGSEYHSQVLTLFPNLGSLDRNPITEEMRQTAQLWHKKKLDEEERRKREEEKLRQEMAQTVGPPGSREQVIYQARRRWESLRNFVKSSNNNNGPPSESSAISSPSAVNTKKTVIKSMKKVVTVATEIKAKKQAELLYPPATLDLEEFPDGQENLEKMESLLSCRSREGLPFHSGNEQKSETSGHVKSHHAPNQNETVDSSFKVNLDNKSGETEVEMHSDIKVNEKNEETMVQQYEAPLILSIMPTTNKLAEENKYLQEQQQLEHHLKAENQCPGSSSARSSSAKVAVVRPLVHRSATVEEQTSTDNNGFLPLSFKEPSGEHIENDANLPESNQSFAKHTEVVFVVADNSFLEKPTDEICADGLEDISNAQIQHIRVEEVKNEPELISQPNVLCSSPPQTQSIETDGNLIQEQQPTIQRESARVKSKLLKHLRSISLDSYPHPFLRPSNLKSGSDAPGGGSSSINSASPMIPSDDDDDGEEDDDNDNEVVQDFDCDDDDAYSIATSTCTTVTSGSTPRRSSTVVATTNRLLKNGVLRKQTFPRTRSQRIKLRDRAAKLFGSTSDLSPRSNSGTTTSKRINSGTGTRDFTNGTGGRSSICGRILRRCDSAASLSTSGPASSSTSSTLGALGNAGSNGGSAKLMVNALPGNNETGDTQNGPSPFRKQGVDFLVEVEGKMLNVFGQGGLRPALTAFASNVSCHVITAKFHYISYDSIIPFFGKLRQVYPSLEHFHFRANNLCTLAQLDALSDLQGLTSLFIAKEGNPVVNHEAWAHYASYRLSHWGLQIINGKEVCSEYRGGVNPATQAKGFESLGFLALSCLPQTALTPLAKRLHMLHCFCCCSPSTSSDESNRRLVSTVNQHHARLLQSPSQATTEQTSSANFCTAWDDDPVLLDVIGKEALVYCPQVLPPDIIDSSAEINSNTYQSPPSLIIPPPIVVSPSASNSSTSFEKKRADTLGHLVKSGVEIVEKVDMLEKTWPTLMTQVIQEMLMDFRFMDSYMKKELKKCHDITLISQQQQHHSQTHHWRKNRH